MIARGAFSDEMATCVHCGNAIETLGHRWWRCPAWHWHRLAVGLDRLKEAALPRCLTRCGIAPKNRIAGLTQAHWRELVVGIQTMMVNIAVEAARAPRAIVQFKLAAGKEHGNSYLDSSFELTGSDDITAAVHLVASPGVELGSFGWDSQTFVWPCAVTTFVDSHVVTGTAPDIHLGTT